MKHSTPLVLAGIALLLFPAHQIKAQTEDPAQQQVHKVIKPARIQAVGANVIPLIWKAVINNASISLPLRNIEFYGVQEYVVNDATRVRELTISTNSRNFIRIYFIQALTAVDIASDRIASLKKIADGQASGNLKLPVKVFPITTHSHMVEYRVSDESQIGELYNHLEATMIEYHARRLIPEQRNLTIREIKIKD